MSMREVDGIEEERRLFYVALTRAQDTLALCYHAPLRRSRFIEELKDLEKLKRF
jgi:superfamily I DNA/RNA helicase